MLHISQNLSILSRVQNLLIDLPQKLKSHFSIRLKLFMENAIGHLEMIKLIFSDGSSVNMLLDEVAQYSWFDVR